MIDWERVGLPRWYDSKLGRCNDRKLGRLVGVSQGTIRYRRELFGIPAWSARKRPVQRVPAGHPLRAFQQLIGLVPDDELATRAGVAVELVAQIRSALALQEVQPEPVVEVVTHPAYHGPLLGFEPLLTSMTAVMISRATGLPLSVIEARRDFLGVARFVRVSKLERYRYLLGRVSNYAVARFVGVSVSRVTDYRKQKPKQPAT